MVVFIQLFALFQNDETIQKLSTTHGILSEIYFYHNVCFCAGWQNLMHTPYIFSVILNAIKQTLLFIIWNSTRLRKARAMVPRNVRTCSEDTVSLGSTSCMRNNTSLDTFWTDHTCFSPDTWNNFTCTDFILLLNSSKHNRHYCFRVTNMAILCHSICPSLSQFQWM